MAHPQGTASAPTENSGTHASLQCTRSGAFPGQEPTSSGGAVEAINQEAEQKHTSLRLNPSTDKGNTVLTQGIVGVITAEPTLPLPVTSDSVANAATVAATIVQQDGAHEQVQAGTPEQSQGASTNATLTDNEEEATHTTPTHTASILQHHPSRPENGVPLAIIGSTGQVRQSTLLEYSPTRTGSGTVVLGDSSTVVLSTNASRTQTTPLGTLPARDPDDGKEPQSTKWPREPAPALDPSQKRPRQDDVTTHQSTEEDNQMLQSKRRCIGSIHPERLARLQQNDPSSMPRSSGTRRSGEAPLTTAEMEIDSNAEHSDRPRGNDVRISSRRRQRSRTPSQDRHSDASPKRRKRNAPSRQRKAAQGQKRRRRHPSRQHSLTHYEDGRQPLLPEHEGSSVAYQGNTQARQQIVYGAWCARGPNPHTPRAQCSVARGSGTTTWCHHG